jgi:hypothetical protein
VVKTGGSERKPPISPSTELGVSQSQKKKMDGGKKVRMKLMPTVCTLQVCSLETATVKNEFDGKNVYWRHTFWVRQVYEMTGNSVVSGFHRDADEICALLRHNAASNRNSLPTFRDNVSVPSSRVKKT